MTATSATVPPERPVNPVMPGRAVDIVHAAILAADRKPAAIEIRFEDHGAPYLVDVQLRDRGVEFDARAVLAQLAATSITTRRYGTPDGLGDITGDVEAIGLPVRIITLLAALVDVAALVADVDARRAAEDDT